MGLRAFAAGAVIVACAWAGQASAELVRLVDYHDNGNIAWRKINIQPDGSYDLELWQSRTDIFTSYDAVIDAVRYRVEIDAVPFTPTIATSGVFAQPIAMIATKDGEPLGDVQGYFLRVLYPFVGDEIAEPYKEIQSPWLDLDVDPLTEPFSYTIGDTAFHINVRYVERAVVIPAIPEPSTWLMMLIGFAGLTLARRYASTTSLDQAVTELS